MTTLGYCRLSKADRNSVAIDQQERAIRAFCSEAGFPTPRIYSDDGVSGGLPCERRPAFARMVMGEGDAVIAYRVDRLGRDAADVLATVAKIRASGALLYFAEDNTENSPSGNFHLGLQALLAAFERETLKARTAKALQERKKQGRRWTRQAPYGWRWEENRIAPVPEEQEAIGRMREVGWDVWLINAAGMRQRSGIPWTSRALIRVSKGSPPPETTGRTPDGSFPRRGSGSR